MTQISNANYGQLSALMYKVIYERLLRSERLLRLLVCYDNSKSPYTDKSYNEKIKAIVPIEKFCKGEIQFQDTSKENGFVRKQSSKRGKTLVTGYVNRNNQENIGCLNRPGNHNNQMLYAMRCNNCGFEYEANGCDIAIRKCPNCSR